ncbi:6-pyruvoyl trahydropterin synthase family protein [Pseudonocardia acaciae]|uniref:6-pyruvoyl trahydropterin synthase family protein n=1 Tax=Pseudonocardia acaciae TaxID=551276 RepID=UPI0004909A39|nr:6-carboxytetrahydropterin synthase [Pseudonocardia acaciae]
MSFTISKQWHFSASHRLDGLPEDHPCARLHGHNYRVVIELAAQKVDTVGFVFDYAKLDPFGRWLDAQVDHRHLNDLTVFNPTAENLAMWLGANFVQVVELPKLVDRFKVTVCETPKTAASWEASL